MKRRTLWVIASALFGTAACDDPVVYSLDGDDPAPDAAHDAGLDGTSGDSGHDAAAD